MSCVVRFASVGGPEVLEIENINVRIPRSDEVRIAVKAIGLNRAESMWRKGQYVESPELPAKIGYEASGLIESLGSDVKNLNVGDAVSIVPGFSMNDYGMYGELVIAPAAMVVRHPPSLTFEEAASIWMMFLTAYGALVETAKPAPGSAVLIPAASSSVGLAAIQIVNELGAISIALTRTEEKKKLLLDAGAAYVIVTDTDDLVAEVARITNGLGAEVVFDPVAGPNFPKLIEAMAIRGKLVMYGALSNSATPMPVLDVLTKLPTIYGYTIWGTTSDPVRLRAATKYILANLKSGVFKPVIDRVIPFDQIVDAHRYLEANEQFGKIIVSL